MLLLQILLLHAFAFEQGDADSKDLQLSFEHKRELQDYQAGQPRRRTLNCRGANDGCGANGNGELGLGMGDCDSDADCAGSLVCTDSSCPWGDEDDCCTAQGCLCNREGAKNEWCRTTGNDGGCGLAGYLTEGMGDCDSDSDCVGKLVCQKNACPWGDNDDCCVKPRNNPLNAACEWKTGDGKNTEGLGSEEMLTGTYDTARECADKVWKSRPTANGATWSISTKKCYAEYRQNGVTSTNSYKNCKFIDWWKVTKGDCKISGSNHPYGNCISSPNYPNYYGNNEECDFQVAHLGRFQIEDWHVNEDDTFMWPNRQWGVLYEYSDLLNEAEGMHMYPERDVFQWRTDGSNVNQGWKLCLLPPRTECTGSHERWEHTRNGKTTKVPYKVSPLIGTRCTSECYKSKGYWGDSWCRVDGYTESEWGAECGAKYCGSCDHEQGVRYGGSTLRSVNAETAEKCQKRCTSDGGCRYWTFTKTQGTASTRTDANCQFKSSDSERTSYSNVISGGQCKWMTDSYLVPPAEEALADAFDVVLPAQEDSPQVVLHAFAALGVAVLAYGAFKYYTKKNADYQEVEV